MDACGLFPHPYYKNKIKYFKYKNCFYGIDVSGEYPIHTSA